MNTHKVEVDDEVFTFVQKHAEPLVDSFNSALRRILVSGRAMVSQGRPAVTTDSIIGVEGYQLPPGTPQALCQILDVVRLVRSGSASRRSATQQIAKKHRVTPQTVVDKYTRQLGLTAARFDRLLSPEKSEELRNLLHAKFPEHTDTIDQVLGAGRKMPPQESLVEIADRLFGLKHGAELAIPHRGTAPHRPPPDFLQPEHGR